MGMGNSNHHCLLPFNLLLGMRRKHAGNRWYHNAWCIRTRPISTPRSLRGMQPAMGGFPVALESCS